MEGAALDVVPGLVDAEGGEVDALDGVSLWMAGGGLKKGFIYRQTDEYRYRVVENAHTVRDLHATVLTLLGLDYRNLTYRFGGRDFRLADVDGHPIRGILA